MDYYFDGSDAVRYMGERIHDVCASPVKWPTGGPTDAYGNTPEVLYQEVIKIAITGIYGAVTLPSSIALDGVTMQWVMIAADSISSMLMCTVIPAWQPDALVDILVEYDNIIIKELI